MTMTMTMTTTRTAERWWAWHDADSSRWEGGEDAATAIAEARCAEWVAGRSDDGPDDGAAEAEARDTIAEARRHYDADVGAGGTPGEDPDTGDWSPVAAVTGRVWEWEDGAAYTEEEGRAIEAEYQRLAEEVRS